MHRDAAGRKAEAYSKNALEYCIFKKWENQGLIAGYSADFSGRFRYCCPEDEAHYEQVANALGLTKEQMIRVHQKLTCKLMPTVGYFW